MSDSICSGCEYMRQDERYQRCHSPQLAAWNLAGIPAAFERDGEPEPFRTDKNGTGKCGPMHLNFKPKEFV